MWIYIAPFPPGAQGHFTVGKKVWEEKAYKKYISGESLDKNQQLHKTYVEHI